MNENRDQKDKPKDWWKPVFFIMIIVILFIVMNGIGFGENIKDLQDWIASFGLWGPIVFFIIYLGAVIATIPGTIFGFIAGALFGSAVGVILISISSTVGASITFLIARYLARDAVARWLSKNKTMRKLDQLTEEQGIILVGLTRLIPLFPFTLLNYGFGLTKVSFKTYVFWSWLCMLPGTIIVVVGTDALTQGLTQGRVPWELLIVLIITVFVLGVLTWYARRHFKEKKVKITRETINDIEKKL
ncbi:hypothetical protein AYK25_07890 [Thermoplasmatales archaeon SM1-50]|nr:MAG: hypothetical protein AYK25_07890 [Thermoplasmatales archaeon SM1-50]